MHIGPERCPPEVIFPGNSGYLCELAWSHEKNRNFPAVNSDFSRLNLEYLIQARDLAVADPHRAGTILGIPDALTGLLLELTPKMLASLARIHHPLITPHRDLLWWSRLLVALQDGQPGEVETVIEQASLILVTAEEKTNR